MRPEPTEHARYLLALTGPLVLGAATLALARMRPLPRSRSLALLMAAGRAALVVFVIAAVLYQHHVTYDVSYEAVRPFKKVYFTATTLVASIVLAALLTIALRSHAISARLLQVARESRGKRIAALGTASLFVAVWLLTGFNSDASITSVNGGVWDNIPFWVDESFAILNGQAPLVDFHAQYGHLWAYVAAAALAVFGTSFTVYTSVMLAGTAATMLAVLDVFRRLTASSLVALALFLPFVATSFFMEIGPLENRYGPSNLFSLFPIRYAGPYVLLWLVVRRVRRGSERPPILLCVVAGLVAINNVEFGVPAFGATLAALIAAEPSRSRARMLRLLVSAVAGAAGAMAVVSALTLIVAGSLPRFGMLMEFPQIYSDGFGMMAMPSFGLHAALYTTFAATLVTAIVRVVGRTGDTTLTSALAWVGVFGLGAGGYFVGRSHPDVLVNLFSACALALDLLVIVIVRAIAERAIRRPRVVELLVLAGLGIAACSLAQTPTPWSQLQRIADSSSTGGERRKALAAQRAAVAAATRDGERVALLMRDGHRIAEEVGVVNVTPYANIESMPTKQQWVEMVDALRRAGGTRIITPTDQLLTERMTWINQSGYDLRQSHPKAGLIVFVARP